MAHTCHKLQEYRPVFWNVNIQVLIGMVIVNLDAMAGRIADRRALPRADAPALPFVGSPAALHTVIADEGTHFQMCLG